MAMCLLGLGALGVLLLAESTRGATAPSAVDAAPGQRLAQGTTAFQRGDFRQAAVHWTEAARLYEQQAQPAARSVALTHLAQAYQALGQYREAKDSLHVARMLAEKAADRMQLAVILGHLGNVYVAIGPAKATAKEHFDQALAIARELGNLALTAHILNNLGNLFTARNQPRQAFEAYRESVQFARQAGNHAMTAQALTNMAMAARLSGQYPVSKTLLDEAVEQMHGLEPSHDKAYGLIKIGLGYDDLRPQLPSLHESLLLRAAEALNAAANVAQTIADPQAISYAWGYLGRLYSAEHRHEEALQLTRQAVAAAQQVHAPESLYRWQWQTGRLLKAQGQIDAAITAYRQALETLQTVRLELSTSYGKPPTAFRTSIGPVYFELVDLLLQRAATVPERTHYASYLQEARQTVELFKAAELRDYFRDDCVDTARTRSIALDVVSQTAAIVYPIPLPERLELLVSLPTGLQKFSVPVTEDTLVRTVRGFREGLQQGEERRARRHAQRLYDWLVRPFEPEVVGSHIDTLVFVPDGALRTIPMAALHDGTQFLIKKYALATTPGLDLTDPRPLPRGKLQVLAAGVAEPVQDFSALPHVPEELCAIQQILGGKVLLNQDFLLSRVENELRKGTFRIIHLASHGQFASDAAQSFILTFDDKLTMDQLAQVVGRLRFRDEPLELLTLSACETAADDDRAALGLAGIAVKAGARSALATLWPVADDAAALLMTEFYRQLQEPTVSKAVALQRAQLKLLDDAHYQEPFFWAPFLLINNWL